MASGGGVRTHTQCCQSRNMRKSSSSLSERQSARRWSRVRSLAMRSSCHAQPHGARPALTTVAHVCLERAPIGMRGRAEGHGSAGKHAHAIRINQRLTTCNRKEMPRRGRGQGAGGRGEGGCLEQDCGMGERIRHRADDVDDQLLRRVPVVRAQPAAG